MPAPPTLFDDLVDSAYERRDLYDCDLWLRRSISSWIRACCYGPLMVFGLFDFDRIVDAKETTSAW